MVLINNIIAGLIVIILASGIVYSITYSVLIVANGTPDNRSEYGTTFCESRGLVYDNYGCSSVNTYGIFIREFDIRFECNEYETFVYGLEKCIVWDVIGYKELR